MVLTARIGLVTVIVCSCMLHVHPFTIRLQDGQTSSEGRVEVYNADTGSWGTVCDDVWDINDAIVVCRQLGLGTAVSATTSASFGQGTGDILFDDVQCTGSETNLGQCTYSSSHNCGHSEDAGVVCRTGIAFPIRLVGGSSSVEGRVEVFVNNEWGTVCDDQWDITDATVVCKQLNLGVANSARTDAHFGEGSGPIVMDDVQCSGTETQLYDCSFTESHNCGHSEDAGVVCSGELELGSIRLIDGEDAKIGRLEVYYNDVLGWGTVCDDSWDHRDAEVVCRELGYAEAEKVNDNDRYLIGTGTGPIALSNVQCNGGESRLVHCPNDGWYNHHCSHDEDVIVICKGSTITHWYAIAGGAATLFFIIYFCVKGHKKNNQTSTTTCQTQQTSYPEQSPQITTLTPAVPASSGPYGQTPNTHLNSSWRSVAYTNDVAQPSPPPPFHSNIHDPPPPFPVEAQQPSHYPPVNRQDPSQAEFPPVDPSSGQYNFPPSALMYNPNDGMPSLDEPPPPPSYDDVMAGNQPKSTAYHY